MSTEPVLVTERVGTDGRVLVATLNRPTKGNALNRPLIEALDALAAEVEATCHDAEGPRALVLTGAGAKAFSAGADVHELDGIDGPSAREQMRRGQLAFGRLERLPVVVIAAVNGFALGGGLELAMAADLRVAAPTARLGQPEITLENLPGWGGTQRLPRLVGRGVATELILTGELISAERALALGLVNRVADDALAAAVALADQIAARNPVAVAGAKRSIRVGLEAGVAAGLEVEADAVAACCETAEQRAAVHAFLHRKR
ncbi:MAG TPA: enoyl-CoA hydratase-related protein [Actinomycetes bacterium]|nr:enoyl-CoA hydratase-related protein [Actinomycetes bacterium]